MTDYLTALQIVLDHQLSFGTETLMLKDTDRRILAEDVFADRDYPPFNRAMMDGYAIDTRDLSTGKKVFRIQQVIFAGEVPDADLLEGACYKIMTGAPLPPSANAVIRREDTFEDNGLVSFTVEKVLPFQSVARNGEDMKAGERIVKANTICSPSVISLLASLGKVNVKVFSLPKVAIFTTGNEVVDPYLPVSGVQIRNGNAYLLKSLLSKWLITPFILAHIPDNKQQLTDQIAQALSADIIITCGGVSAGEADFLPEVLGGLGVEKLFHKVSIRPGKPIWSGKLPAGPMVFALPGNPFSCLVDFKLFVEPYLLHCWGLPPTKMFTLPFNGNRINKSGLDEFFPVNITGKPSALVPVSINSSGDVRLGLNAEAIAWHPAGQTEIRDSDLISCFLL